MRKLILISAFAFASITASVSAQADDRNLILAANDTPAAASTTPPAGTTAPVEAKSEGKSEAATDTSKPEAKKQASKPQKTQARRETDEQKARRIAAKYGVYW